MPRRNLFINAVLSLVVVTTSTLLAQASNNMKPVNPAFTAQGRATREAKLKNLIGSLSKEQKAQIKTILNNDKIPAAAKVAKGNTSQRPVIDIAQMKSLGNSIATWQSKVDPQIKAVLNAQQAADFDASKFPGPDHGVENNQTGSGYCYDAYYYNYYGGYTFAYYTWLYAFYQAFYDGDPVAYDAYSLAVGSYFSSYYAQLYSYNAYAYDQSTYGFATWYWSNYATFESLGVSDVELNLGYYMDGSSNAYNVYANANTVYYWGANYSDIYAYYCYLGY